MQYRHRRAHELWDRRAADSSCRRHGRFARRRWKSRTGAAIRRIARCRQNRCRFVLATATVLGNATKRRWTLAIGDEVRNLPVAGVVANVIGGDNGCAGTFRHRNAGAIHARAKTFGIDRVDPREKIVLLRLQQASAFFLIEKDNGVRREALAFGSGDGGLSVGRTELFGFVAFQLRVSLAVEQEEETESGFFDNRPLARPCVRFCARRIIEPVSGEGESLVQGSELVVAGIDVAIETTR